MPLLRLLLHCSRPLCPAAAGWLLQLSLSLSLCVCARRRCAGERAPSTHIDERHPQRMPRLVATDAAPLHCDGMWRRARQDSAVPSCARSLLSDKQCCAAGRAGVPATSLCAD